MTSWEDLKSNKALVCHKERVTDAGAGIIWYVLLGDAYLLDCASGQAGKKRAETLAAIINEAGPDRLGRDTVK